MALFEIKMHEHKVALFARNYILHEHKVHLLEVLCVMQGIVKVQLLNNCAQEGIKAHNHMNKLL